MQSRLKGWYDALFRPWPPIGDLQELGDFIDAQAAFLTQKGIYEYARARAGHYSKVLFGEQSFRDAIEISRWQAYPLGLAMVCELTEGVVAGARGADRGPQLRRLRSLTLSVFDRYPVPVLLGEGPWGEARVELDRRL